MSLCEYEYSTFVKPKNHFKLLMPLLLIILISYHKLKMNSSYVLSENSQQTSNLVALGPSSGKVKGKKNVRVPKKDIFDEKGEDWCSNKKSTSYYWTSTEKAKYFRFLQEYGYLLQLSPEERKRKKVNLIMSKKIKTRNSTQCHTHHQKMIQKYKTVQGILESQRKQKEDSVPMNLQVISKVEAVAEEKVGEMKTASQILAICPIAEPEAFSYMEEVDEISQFYQMRYHDPFVDIDFF